LKLSINRLSGKGCRPEQVRKFGYCLFTVKGDGGAPESWRRLAQAVKYLQKEWEKTMFSGVWKNHFESSSNIKEMVSNI